MNMNYSNNFTRAILRGMPKLSPITSLSFIRSGGCSSQCDLTHEECSNCVRYMLNTSFNKNFYKRPMCSIFHDGTCEPHEWMGMISDVITETASNV